MQLFFFLLSFCNYLVQSFLASRSDFLSANWLWWFVVLLFSFLQRFVFPNVLSHNSTSRFLYSISFKIFMLTIIPHIILLLLITSDFNTRLFNRNLLGNHRCVLLFLFKCSILVVRPMIIQVLYQAVIHPKCLDLIYLRYYFCKSYKANNFSSTLISFYFWIYCCHYVISKNGLYLFLKYGGKGRAIYFE